MSRPAIPRQVRCTVFRRDRFRCRYCARRINYRTGTLDHVIPHSDDGPSAPWNLVTSCWPCNAAKGCRTLDALGWHLLPCGMTRTQAVAFGIVLPLYPERYRRGQRSKQFPKRRMAAA
jgi:hypothetical protein